MTTADVIDDLTRQGYRLIPKPGGILRIEPTPPPELVTLIREHKADILAVLHRQQSPATSLVSARITGKQVDDIEAPLAAPVQDARPPELTLYVSKRSGLRAWSRWSLDEQFWMPELN